MNIFFFSFCHSWRTNSWPVSCSSRIRWHLCLHRNQRSSSRCLDSQWWPWSYRCNSAVQKWPNIQLYPRVEPFSVAPSPVHGAEERHSENPARHKFGLHCAVSKQQFVRHSNLSEQTVCHQLQWEALQDRARRQKLWDIFLQQVRQRVPGQTAEWPLLQWSVLRRFFRHRN